MLKLLTVLLLSSVSLVEAQKDFAPICGDCWCIKDDANSNCPVFDENLYQTFPKSWVDLHKSSVLTSPPITYGSECYPFAVGPLDNYELSSLPQCQLPANADQAVCAYKYESVDNPSTCQGRRYEIITYASESELASDDVKLHNGPCGVCSNANDLAVRMETIDQLSSIALFCGTTYFLNTKLGTRFDELISCFTKIGFTEPCATHWAHFTATNAAVCPNQCISDSENDSLFGPAPTCQLGDCLSCSRNSFEADFNVLGGIYKSGYNAGLVDEVAYSCSVFVPSEGLDPCYGTGLVATDPPTAAPTAVDSSASIVHLSPYLLLLLFVI